MEKNNAQILVIGIRGPYRLEGRYFLIIVRHYGKIISIMFCVCR